MSKKGENIYKRKDGRWEGRYIRCYDENGKAKYGYIYGKTYNETKQKLILKKSDTGKQFENLSNSTTLYNEILDSWLQSVRINVKESTYARYSHLIDTHVRTHLGQYQITKISTQLVERFIKNQLSNGRLKDGSALSSKTVIDILTIVKSSMEYAKYNNLNVICNLSKLTVKKKDREMRVLNLSEQKALLNVLLHDMDLYKFGVILSLYTGIRVGELCALQWEDISLAVYSVKVNTDPDNPQEVATMDESKKQLLTDIFWEMNEISSSTDTKTETVITETDDGHGNIVETESTVTQTYLYITVSHKTADEMAAQYGFNEEQKEYLAELLADENNSLWSQVLYGITGTDDQIVTVALSQIGTMGGDPYWSWYGFNSRVEWCACFVSWCANECGYIDAGVIPKYAGCVNGVQWFKDRGQWLDNSAEPTPGMIIFFDWADESGQDGLSDHTGIVQKVENGRVYTVEGNSGDSVRQNSYPVGYYEILGYGAPAY